MSSMGLPLTDFDPTKPKYECRATQLTPRPEVLFNGEPIIIDFEFQKFAKDGVVKQKHRIGRAGIINTVGEVVLDAYADYPEEDDIEWRRQPPEFGVVKPDTYIKNGAVPGRRLEAQIKELVRDRVVILHGGQHDLTTLYFEKDVWSVCAGIEDTQNMYFQVQGPNGLKDLVGIHLGQRIREGDGIHTPIEDARATLGLWLLKRPEYNRAAELAKAEAKAEEKIAKEKSIKEKRTKAKNAKGKRPKEDSDQSTPAEHGKDLASRLKAAEQAEREKWFAERRANRIVPTSLSGNSIMTMRAKPQQRTPKPKPFKVPVADENAFPALGS